MLYHLYITIGSWMCGDFSDNLSTHSLFISTEGSEVAAHTDLNTTVSRVIPKQVSVTEFKPHHSIW